MTVYFHTTASTSYHHSVSGIPQPSLSCATRFFVGFTLQSPGSFCVAKPNSHSKFRTPYWTFGSKPRRGRINRSLGVPLVPYTAPGDTGLGWMDFESVLERERIIFIGRHIDEGFTYEIVSTVLYLDSAGSKRPLFFFFVDCLGGDVNPSLSIYDTMQSLESPVGTRCMGYAANMAAFLLAAGNKGARFALPHSTITLQSLAGSAHGQADHVCNEANELSRVTDYICNQLATMTGRPVEKIYKDLNGAKEFSAQEALEYGLIDLVARPPRLTPNPLEKDTPRRLLNYD